MTSLQNTVSEAVGGAASSISSVLTPQFWAMAARIGAVAVGAQVAAGLYGAATASGLTAEQRRHWPGQRPGQRDNGCDGRHRDGVGNCVCDGIEQIAERGPLWLTRQVLSRGVSAAIGMGDDASGNGLGTLGFGWKLKGLAASGDYASLGDLNGIIGQRYDSAPERLDYVPSTALSSRPIAARPSSMFPMPTNGENTSSPVAGAR